MNLLLDTNVLIDYFARRRPYCDEWGRLLAMRELGDVELWAPSFSLTEAYRVLRPAVDEAALQAAFAGSLEFLRVCSVGEGDIKDATARAWPDFCTALVYACAAKMRADYIITRDPDAFSLGGIPALSIPEFFARLEQDYGIVYGEVDL